MANLNTSSRKQNGQGSQLPPHQLIPQVFKQWSSHTLGEDVAQLILGFNLLEQISPLHDILPEPHYLGAMMLLSWGELDWDSLN